MQHPNSLAATIPQIPSIHAAFDNADFVDIKTVESERNLRQFIADFINYQPTWVTFLYGMRWFFVRLLGMKQRGIPRSPGIRPEALSFIRGERLTFFTVEDGQEDSHLLVSITEKHLKARLGIVAQPLGEAHRRFYVVTWVYYRHWTGPIYFNIIRPFHHLIVQGMIRAATKT